jgi:hypothetical protein
MVLELNFHDLMDNFNMLKRLANFYFYFFISLTIEFKDFLIHKIQKTKWPHSLGDVVNRCIQKHLDLVHTT